jgi:FkbM family methyltransferase
LERLNRAALRALRTVLRRARADWHPTRHPVLERVLAAWVDRARDESLATRHGFTITVPRHHRSPLTPRIFLDGEYEPVETQRIRHLLVPGDVAFDIGANIGYTTCLMAQMVGPGGAIHAFEPEPENFAVLVANVAHNGFANTMLRELALSDRCGPQPLFLSRTNHGDHTLVASAGRQTRPVQSTTFDEYCRRSRPARRARLVKIDVQGHELEVLTGMRRSLAAGAVDAILLELWPARTSRILELLRTIADLPFRVSILSASDGDTPASFTALEARLSSSRVSSRASFGLLLESRLRPPATLGSAPAARSSSSTVQVRR